MLVVEHCLEKGHLRGMPIPVGAAEVELEADPAPGLVTLEGFG